MSGQIGGDRDQLEPRRSTTQRGHSYFQKIVFVVMDIRFLESFVMVIESGSMAEAARRLNLTAAAVAQRIHTLEREIGTRLIMRSGRSVMPTHSGTAILSRARDLLGEVRDLKAIACEDRLSGQLRLGATPTATSGILPDILARLTTRYPQIDVELHGGISAELYRMVLDGDLDAALIVQPPFTLPKAYSWLLLSEEPLVVLTPRATRLRDPIAILSSEPLIRQHHSTWIGRLIDGYLRHAGVRPRERFAIDTLEAIAVMVDRGLGVALVHDWPPPWPEGLSLRKIPIPEKRFGRRMGLLWPRASVRMRLVHALVEVATASEPRH
jgi:DNA-binding transcriptional LysR family regulator